MIFKVSSLAYFLIYGKEYDKVISVVDPDYEIKQLHSNHLILKIWDIETTQDLISLQFRLLKVLIFGKNIQENDKVLIHCSAGMKRSPAILYGLLWNKYHNITTINKIIDQNFPNGVYPNRLIMQVWKDIMPDFPYYITEKDLFKGENK